jgi:signal transduction histidine kinase
MAVAGGGAGLPDLAGVPDADATFGVMTALSAAGAAALAVAVDDTVTSATPEAERMLATPIARLRGARLSDLVTLAGQAGPALAAARRAGARQGVAGIVTADGRSVAVEWVPGLRRGAGVAVLLSDRPPTEDAERLRLQTRLVSFISHDVRNSLAAAYCGLRTLSDQLPASATERGTVDRALGDVQRASRIVEDVLAVSRPGRLHRVELDLTMLLRETLHRFRTRAAANGVELVERFESGAAVLADLSQLERAFDNLVENALQAMPHGGMLTVATRGEDRAGPGVLITIADTGLGIPADVRPNVFEPYATRKKDGTGLGLAITRRAVLDHEGQIDFTTAEGRGTTFAVWLPCP